jgi:hypothetical protein
MTEPIRTAVNSATGAIAITPGTAFNVCRAVLAGTGGAAACTFQDGSVATVTLIAGYNPISITNVAAAGLAAEDLVALY